MVKNTMTVMKMASKKYWIRAVFLNCLASGAISVKFAYKVIASVSSTAGGMMFFLIWLYPSM